MFRFKSTTLLPHTMLYMVQIHDVGTTQQCSTWFKSMTLVPHNVLHDSNPWRWYHTTMFYMVQIHDVGTTQQCSTWFKSMTMVPHNVLHDSKPWLWHHTTTFYHIRHPGLNSWRHWSKRTPVEIFSLHPMQPPWQFKSFHLTSFNQPWQFKSFHLTSFSQPWQFKSVHLTSFSHLDSSNLFTSPHSATQQLGAVKQCWTWELRPSWRSFPWCPPAACDQA